MSRNKLETVKAFNFSMELTDTPASNTRLINGEYYIIGESCFKMEDGQYYRINSGKIFYNHTKKIWQTYRDHLIFGIINSNDGVPVVGYYEPHDEVIKVDYGKSVKQTEDGDTEMFQLKVETSNMFLEGIHRNPSNCASIELAEELGFVESLASGKYYYKPSLTSRELKSLKTKGRAQYDLGRLPYNIADNNTFGSSIKKAYKKELYEGNILDKQILEIIGKRSFGLEIETSIGHIPIPILNRTGLVPLRDGSIGGVEYTTVPLEGIKGVATLRTIFKEVNKRCDADEQCSLHIHFGKFPCTKKASLALYTLCYRLQNELFEIVPPYKRDLNYFANKRGNDGRMKDHCKPLPGLALNTKRIFEEEVDMPELINEEFGKIFEFLTEGKKQDENYNFETRRHPKEGIAKWNWDSRYYHVNMIPLLFSKSRTVEFRLHQATIHYSVMLHWFLICNSILNYAEENQDKILESREKITLLDVISPIRDVSEDMHKKLDAYIYYRRELFNNDRYRDIYAEIKRDSSNVSLPKELEFNEL